MMEDFGYMEADLPEWLDRSDDYNVWEEAQVFADNEGAADEVVEADDVAGFEDDGYEEALGLD